MYEFLRELGSRAIVTMMIGVYPSLKVWGFANTVCPGAKGTTLDYMSSVAHEIGLCCAKELVE